MITLSEIKNNFISKDQNEAIRAFLWSFIWDRSIIQSKHKLFYTDIDKQVEDIFRVIDTSYSKKYKPETFKTLHFEPEKWVIKEFFNNKPFSLNLPVWTWKEITIDLFRHFLSVMVKERIIDDLTYTIIKNICSLLWVYYDDTKKIVTFWDKAIKWKIKSWSVLTRVKVKDISLEEVLQAEIDQWYINKEIGDPERDFAYWHMLRKHAWFKLFTWAKKVIIWWKKYNVLWTSRWQGKTYFAAKLAARELLSTKPWFWWRPYREIKYFVPEKSNIWDQAMQYIESLLWDLLNRKLENWKKLFDISRAKQEIKCNLTGNTFKVISLFNMDRWNNELGNSTWEGIACDFAIIDEAARISNSFWASFHQRAAFETSDFFIVSTINEETPVDHWFYKLLIDWELENDDIVSYRVTIDENEAMRQWKTEEEFLKQVEIAKTALRSKWDKEFYSKWYCIILEESNVFNTWTYLIPPNYSKYQDSDPRILWFDLWKLTDTCWLVLINLKHREIEEAKKVLNATYWTQLIYAEEYKKKYKNLFVIWDRSWVWESVSEQDTKWIVDTWIKSTGSWELSYNKKFWFWTCNKWKIITTMATILNINLLKINSDLNDLADQMNSFIKLKSLRWEVILYKGKWTKKDDLVLSSAYACLYMYSILWLQTEKDIENYVNEIWTYETYSYNDIVEETNSKNYHNWLY